MKKITLFFIILISSSISFAQNWTTGDVQLTSGYTVRFDVNTTSDIVTMTMVGPSDQWLGMAISNTTYTPTNGMGQFNGDDTIVYTSNTIQDRTMPSSNGAPSLDSSQDWTIVTGGNTVSSGVRTVIATRNRVSAGDFTFPTTPPSVLTFVWARGGAGTSNTFGFHTGGRGAVLANNNVLSTDDFEINTFSFDIFPNPSRDDLNIDFSNTTILNGNFNIEVFDVLGKQIFRTQLSNDISTSIDTSNWRSGVYLVKVTTANATQAKRFVKQ